MKRGENEEEIGVGFREFLFLIVLLNGILKGRLKRGIDDFFFFVNVVEKK